MNNENLTVRNDNLFEDILVQLRQIKEENVELRRELLSLKEEKSQKETEQSNAAMHSRIKPNPPPMYDGKKDAVVLENWIFRVAYFVTANNLRGEMAVNTAATYLDGRALLFWRAIRLDLQNYDHHNSAQGNFDKFCGLMKSYFYPQGSILKGRDELAELKQNKSAYDFSRDFERILLQLPKSEYNKSEMVDRYV